MCMNGDDEEGSLTCFDAGTSTPAQATGSIVSGNAGSSGAASSGKKFCGKCAGFWLIILAVVAGLIWYSRK
jgi:hypothetical protein